MASSIDDLALAYAIMAQPDPEDRGSARFPNPTLAPDVGAGKRKYLGICEEWVDRADADVRKMLNAAVEHYVEQGYEKISINLPYLPEGQKAHALTILSEVRSGVTAQQISKLTYPNQLLLNVAGGHATAQDFLYSQRLRDLQMRHLSWLWEEYPGMVIITPTTPCAGWKIGNPKDVVKGGWGVSDGDKSLRSMEYVYLANWTGCPAITFPMGYTAEGVPVGMMVSFCRSFVVFADYGRAWVFGAQNSNCSGLARKEKRFLEKRAVVDRSGTLLTSCPTLDRNENKMCARFSHFVPYETIVSLHSSTASVSQLHHFLSLLAVHASLDS
jgi:hypothetical protein